MTPAPDERERIRAATDRILAGTPQCSTGALTIVALAAEDGVPRNALTQRHLDLKTTSTKRYAPGVSCPTASGVYASRSPDSRNYGHATPRRSPSYAPMSNTSSTPLINSPRRTTSCAARQAPRVPTFSRSPTHVHLMRGPEQPAQTSRPKY